MRAFGTISNAQISNLPTPKYCKFPHISILKNKYSNDLQYKSLDGYQENLVF
jgi:hypothetical protein